MNKQTIIRFLFRILASITLFVLSSCGTVFIATRPAQSPTPLPPYIHYRPSKFDVHLEFDYPSSWVFGEEKQDGGPLIVIGLGDPQFRSLPTSPPNGLNRIPNDFGNINIWVLPSESGQVPDTEIEALKQVYKNEPRITLLKDYKIVIDGYDASVLEYEISDSESYTSLMFARRIIFIVKGQLYQMYQIFFTIAEKDRGGNFEKGYEYFFNSLKIVP